LGSPSLKLDAKLNADFESENMRHTAALCPVLTLGLMAVVPLALAQDSAALYARLDWVPISGAERNDVGGTGSMIARLTRSGVSIEGCFAGLPAAATRASFHLGVATGARGPSIAELTITKATSGTVSGDVALDRAQRDAVLAGHAYIQLHAERGVAPDNAVLWGWLLANQKPSPCGEASR
jgi:hypothetical protein